MTSKEREIPLKMLQILTRIQLVQIRLEMTKTKHCTSNHIPLFFFLIIIINIIYISIYIFLFHFIPVKGLLVMLLVGLPVAPSNDNVPVLQGDTLHQMSLLITVRAHR